MKILGVGDSVMDAYLHQRMLYPGGNSVNVPVLALRYGAQAAAYIGLMGDDEPGRHFLRVLEEEGLDTHRIRVMRAKTAQNYIRVDETGDRHFVGHNGFDVAQLMAQLRLRDEDYALMEQYDLVHTSVHSFLDEFLPAIGRRAPLSMDFSDGYTPQNIERLCPLLRFAFFSGGHKSEDEIETLAQSALRSGARTVVITRGLQGSCVFEQGCKHTQKAVQVNAIDALGAGDAYIAAFLFTYLNHDGDIALAAESASEFAAQCCLHHGAFGRALEL
ncbi:PfkB family carbohydrate kinase [Cohnella hongkongensis]|uniref:PfkB family carbohydrate kinase n=1 Tax=Cohnella hongkongensis TaxID=178337 RepID=A0ABV9FKD3_9BACL